MNEEMLCPRCERVMNEYKPNHFKCECGARLKQLTFFEDEPCTERSGE